MPGPISNFGLSDMTRASAGLRTIGLGAGSMEEVAIRTVLYLRDELNDPKTPGSDCPLVRFYKTHPYKELEIEQKQFAVRALGGASIADDAKCLTLLATAGDEPGWNSRKASASHMAIPLTSAEIVARAPMIAALVSQLGIDVATVIAAGQADLLVEQEQKTYNVFLVPDALASPYIPAQREFVVPYGIRSVLGFGGLLPSGELFAVIVFSKVPIPRETADLFKTLALSVKVAILPFVFRTIFA